MNLEELWKELTEACRRVVARDGEIVAGSYGSHDQGAVGSEEEHGGCCCPIGALERARKRRRHTFGFDYASFAHGFDYANQLPVDDPCDLEETNALFELGVRFGREKPWLVPAARESGAGT